MEHTTDQLDAYLMEQASRNHFHGSILLADKNGIILSKGYGYSNYRDKIENGPESRYQIASLTKQFTAVAIMQLHEKVCSRHLTPFNCICPTIRTGTGSPSNTC